MKGTGEKKEKGITVLNLLGTASLQKAKELNKQSIFIEEANTSLLWSRERHWSLQGG